MKRLRYIMLLAGLMSLSLQTINAQRITRSFRNTSMSEALTILAKSTKDYHINFMYDELEDFTVTTSIVEASDSGCHPPDYGFLSDEDDDRWRKHFCGVYAEDSHQDDRSHHRQ